MLFFKVSIQIEISEKRQTKGNEKNYQNRKGDVMSYDQNKVRKARMKPLNVYLSHAKLPKPEKDNFKRDYKIIKSLGL